MKLVSEKLTRAGIRDNELNAEFDLVKSGFVNSLEFVELVSRLEKEYAVEIDFESALEEGSLTTLGGIIKTFEKQING